MHGDCNTTMDTKACCEKAQISRVSGYWEDIGYGIMVVRHCNTHETSEHLGLIEVI